MSENSEKKVCCRYRQLQAFVRLFLAGGGVGGTCRMVEAGH